MPVEPTMPLDLSTWQAADWKELAAIWTGLFPEPEEQEGKTVRTFHSRPLSAQEAGIVFERWVLEAFRLSGTEVYPPYAVTMAQRPQTREQIDGLVLSGWQGFLIESKFWPGKKVDFGPIALLHLRVEQRPVGTAGLVFAPFGYSDAAIDSASALRPIRVILFVQDDLEWALERRNMMEMIRTRWVATVKFGRPLLPIV